MAGALVALAAGCGGKSSENGAGGGPGGGAAGGGGGGGGGGTQVAPPLVTGAFTFHGAGQGFPRDVWDVSADEAGNVYVAAGDAIFAKKRGDASFKRFSAADAGITRNCDAAKTVACPIVSVAGMAPGLAIVGLKGIGTDGDDDPDWQLDSGGADVLAFDGEKLTRKRHVEVAGAPHQMCMDHSPGPCSIGDATWEKGRRKVRQVLRIAVNHDHGAVQYGDAWLAGTHGTFSVLVANPDRRGWVDLTKQFPGFPGIEDRQFVWEHDHPALYLPATINGHKDWAFLTGQSTAIAIDPTTGDPWGANDIRLARKAGYGAVPNGWDVAMAPAGQPGDDIGWYLDVWPDPHPNPVTLDNYDALNSAWQDAVSSLSFCDDGTLWIASLYHGLARRGRDGSLSYVSLPDGLGDDASAVACDPSDGSVWVGFGWGGFGRYDGAWWIMQDKSAPDFALQGPVSSIQIDRWASPRIVYVAHVGSRFGPGGLTIYDGP